MTRKIRLKIEYDGTAYAGWQIQKQGESTIQQKLQRALQIVTKVPGHIQCAGRTDSGVHAAGQVAHFTTDSSIQDFQFREALNANLPPDITILESREVAPEFDARRHARGKIYRYRILNRRARSSLLRHYTWHIKNKLDLQAMQKAAGYLQGEHDFSSFRASGCNAKHPVRYLYLLDIHANEKDQITIDVFGSAFLKQMVRNIVGTLTQIGLGRLTPSDMKGILDARDRSVAGQTAPACGLTLIKVFYPDDPPPPDLLKLIPESHRVS